MAVWGALQVAVKRREVKSEGEKALFSICPQSFPAPGSFPMSCLLASDDQNTGALASASVLPVIIQGWSPLRLTGLISLLSKALLVVFSSTTVWGISSLAFCLLYGPALTIIREHWEDHSLDYTDLCQQSNVSAFQPLSIQVYNYTYSKIHYLYWYMCWTCHREGW